MREKIAGLLREMEKDWKRMWKEGKREKIEERSRKRKLLYRVESCVIGTAVIILAEAGILAVMCTVLWLMKAPPFTPEEWENRIILENFQNPVR